MSKYHIKPAGVKTVLEKTGKDAEEFDTILKPMSGHVKSAASGCGNSGAVAPALEALFTAEGKRIEAIGTRVNACLTGAAAATKAYMKGDEEMVATYQRNAANAKISKMPK